MRQLKLKIQFAPRKNCHNLFTHQFVALCSHSQIILTIVFGTVLDATLVMFSFWIASITQVQCSFRIEQ